MEAAMIRRMAVRQRRQHGNAGQCRSRPRDLLRDQEVHVQRQVQAVLLDGADREHDHVHSAVDQTLDLRATSALTGVPVLPALPYGHSSNHRGFHGNYSLRPETFQKIVEEMSDWMHADGSVSYT